MILDKPILEKFSWQLPAERILTNKYTEEYYNFHIERANIFADYISIFDKEQLKIYFYGFFTLEEYDQIQKLHSKYKATIDQEVKRKLDAGIIIEKTEVLNTNSVENKKIIDSFYKKIKEDNLIVTKTVNKRESVDIPFSTNKNKLPLDYFENHKKIRRSDLEEYSKDTLSRFCIFARSQQAQKDFEAVEEKYKREIAEDKKIIVEGLSYF